MRPTEYWQECISDALEEAGLTASQKQISTIAEHVQGSHENYGMAFYSPPAGEHLRSEIAGLKRQVKREQDKVHCKECNGRGSITTQGPYHSSTGRCFKCNGDGRHDP